MSAFLSRERTAGKNNPHRGENLIRDLSRITRELWANAGQLALPGAKLDFLVLPQLPMLARPAGARVNLARLEAISAVGFGVTEGVSGMLHKPTDGSFAVPIA
ncbi:hypothetical protein [Mycobacterium colombiense]|uniref:hypothetical protein n=1 Tax=Mycobacterium colombiense TaxID=339268 RepID=UPI000B28E4BB|nr:hypothetical protein [Mycobacterium colombiense]